jgi:hypothetical protein
MAYYGKSKVNKGCPPTDSTRMIACMAVVYFPSFSDFSRSFMGM